MAGTGKWKRALGIGCSVVLLIVVGILGVTTWYTGRINEEYKEVRDSEKILLAATEGEEGYRPPAGGIPGPDRIEAFLAVRQELGPWCRTLAAASGKFVEDQERQRSGSLKDRLKLLNTGSDLMPLYAGFWTARNQALLKHAMGPGEYRYIFRLVYQTWLEMGDRTIDPQIYPSENLDEALGPYRHALEAVYDPGIHLVELIFQMDLP